jgi:hypothetical protein
LTVTELLAGSARSRGVELTIEEWPGGEPRSIDLEVAPALLSKVRRGRKSVPLGTLSGEQLAVMAALPHASRVRLSDGLRSLEISSGPARFSNGWWLPVTDASDGQLEKD